MTAEILFDRADGWGLITLNRPEALNALTLGMVEAFRRTLVDWERDPSVRAILVRGAGEKAFCAGGDIRWLHDEARKDAAQACEFFREEYRLNAAIHHLTKPYVALIDGVVMGGGVGVSVHGDFRVAGDRTLFAMPETGIGLFPDVGGGYFMPRLKDGLGLYYALTGARAKAADCMAAGVATHYAPSDKIPALIDALLGLTSLGAHAHAEIEAVLDAHAGDPGAAQVNADRAEIRALFEGRASIDDIIAAARLRGTPFADDIFKTIRKMSPTSLKLTFEQMKRGHGLDFDHVMQMEFRMVCRVMEGRDFFEGVRAQILDKDRNPQWSPAGLDAVSTAEIERYFAPLGSEGLILP